MHEALLLVLLAGSCSDVCGYPGTSLVVGLLLAPFLLVSEAKLVKERRLKAMSANGRNRQPLFIRALESVAILAQV